MVLDVPFRRYFKQRNHYLLIFMSLKQYTKRFISYFKRNIFNYRSVRYSGVHSDLNCIVYLCPASDALAGGIKVIYKHSEIINELKNGFCSEILHAKNPKFKYTWFNSDAVFRESLNIDPSRDFVIIPECMVIPHAKLIKDLGVSYAIFVQNGYTLNYPLYVGDEKALNDAYSNAKCILSISDDTSECIKLAFPDTASKIHRLTVSLDAAKFNPKQDKKNIITYMPRRLSRHSQLVLFFLKNHLPKEWEVVPIDNMTEEDVARLLNSSKVFMSFSELEGLGLPPLEAALAGNIVIGYHGEAGREYWHESPFKLINCGDIKQYAFNVIQTLNQIDDGTLSIDEDSIHRLANQYSEQRERELIRSMLGVLKTRYLI